MNQGADGGSIDDLSINFGDYNAKIYLDNFPGGHDGLFDGWVRRFQRAKDNRKLRANVIPGAAFDPGSEGYPNQIRSVKTGQSSSSQN